MVSSSTFMFSPKPPIRLLLQMLFPRLSMESCNSSTLNSLFKILFKESAQKIFRSSNSLSFCFFEFS